MASCVLWPDTVGVLVIKLKSVHTQNTNIAKRYILFPRQMNRIFIRKREESGHMHRRKKNKHISV